MRNSPPDGRAAVARSRSSVVLPEPFSPSTASESPASRLSSGGPRTVRLPKRCRRPLASIAFTPAPGGARPAAARPRPGRDGRWPGPAGPPRPGAAAPPTPPTATLRRPPAPAAGAAARAGREAPAAGRRWPPGSRGGCLRLPGPSPKGEEGQPDQAGAGGRPGQPGRGACRLVAGEDGGAKRLPVGAHDRVLGLAGGEAAGDVRLHVGADRGVAHVEPRL